MTDKIFHCDRPLLPDNIAPQAGVLTDGQIQSALADGYLLAKDTWDEAQIRYASYELRMSTDVQFLQLDDNPKDGVTRASYIRSTNGIQSPWQLPPGHTVKISTVEQFDIPANIVARATPVGNLWQVGLLPETTFADPGFKGDFWIIVSNFSSRIVTLEDMQPIARLEFVRLSELPNHVHGGAGKRKGVLHWPERIPRRPREELVKIGIEAVLEELASADPPHFEQAFVSSEIRRQLDDRQSGDGAVVQRLARMEGIVTLSMWVLALIGGIAASMWIWAMMPEGWQDKITDGLVGTSVGLILFAVPWLSKRFRASMRKLRSHTEGTE